MKIVMFTNEHLYSNIILRDFITRNHKQIIGIFESNVIVPGKNFLEAIVYLLKHSTLPFTIYKFFEEKLYKFKVNLGLGKLQSFKTYSKKYRIPLYKTKILTIKKQ